MNLITLPLFDVVTAPILIIFSVAALILLAAVVAAVVGAVILIVALQKRKLHRQTATAQRRTRCKYHRIRNALLDLALAPIVSLSASLRCSPSSSLLTSYLLPYILSAEPANDTKEETP